MNTEELQAAYGKIRERADRSLRQTPYQKVREFHETYRQPVGDKPALLSPERLVLRLKLIEEEYAEILEGLTAGDLENVAKELADLIYVVNGMAVEMGIDLDAVVREVHRSNMSKLGADGNPIYREDGKVLKGPNYTEADVAAVLGL